MMLLHLVLTNTVEKLGINAVRYGLPMIFKLQDDLLDDNVVREPRAKVMLASLVHGYLGAISEKFDMETTRVGADIQGEISRMRGKNIWLSTIRFPPLSIEQIAAGPVNPDASINPENLESDPLKPFHSRAELVEEIAKAYDNSLVSPPPSAPSSPGRVFSVPGLGFGYGYGMNPTPKPAPEDQMPDSIKEQLLADWTKDLCVAAVEKDSAQTSSLSGSKKTGGSFPQNYLSVTVNGHAGNGFSGNNSPTHAPDHPKPHHHGGRGSPAFGLVGGHASVQNFHRISTNDGSPGRVTSSSSRDSTIRVNELKRVLSVNRSQVRHSSPLRIRPKSRPSTSIVSDDSDSMVSYSDGEGVEASPVNHNAATLATDLKESTAPSSRPKTAPQAETDVPRTDQAKTTSLPGSPSHQTHHKEYVRPGSRPKNEDIPPVPKIPSSLNLPGGFPSDGSPVRPSTARSETVRHASPSSQRRSVSASADREGRATNRKSRSVKGRENTVELTSWVNRSDLFNHRADLGKLLAGIDVGAGSPPTAGQPIGGINAPPY